MDVRVRLDDFYSELLNPTGDLWNTHRLKELIGCCQATDEELADATRRMKLPGSVYTGLQYANIPCLVEALHALKPQRFFNSEEYKYYTECNGMMPNQARHKCNEFSFKLQQLVTSPTAEIAASLFLSLRNSYEQSCDTNVDSHYQLACVIREGVLRDFGREEMISKERDIEAIISNYPEEDFDEQKAMLLMTHLNIIQPAQQFSNYREIIFQWLNEAKVKKADCRLITLVVALMKSHLGRVMSKLLPTCLSNQPDIKQFIFSLTPLDLKEILNFLGYSENCVEVRAFENACASEPHLRFQMFLRICQFPNCQSDVSKIVQCLKDECTFTQVHIPKSPLKEGGNTTVYMLQYFNCPTISATTRAHDQDIRVLSSIIPPVAGGQIESPSQWTEQIQRWQQGGAPHPQMYSLQDASRHKCMNDSAADYQECREDVSADSQNKTDYSEHHLTQQGPQTSPSQEPLVMSKTDSEQKAENYTSSTLTSSANFQQKPAAESLLPRLSKNNGCHNREEQAVTVTEVQDQDHAVNTDFDGGRFLYHCMFGEWDKADALLYSAVGTIPVEQQPSDLQFGKNAFQYICASGDLDRVRTMVSKGADLAHVDSEGLSILHCKSVFQDVNFLAILLNGFHRNGISVDIPTKQHYLTPLMQAINDLGESAYAVVELLLKYNASPNGNIQAHSRPLTLACQFGSLKLVKLLLAYNADLNAQDKEGNTPLLVACKNSRWEAALHLLEQPEVNFNRSDKSGTTPLFEGVSKCQYDLVERLLQREARVNCTRHISNPEIVGSVEETPLAHACARGLIRYVEILLAHKADINYRCSDTVPPIGFAIISRKNNVVEFLLKQNDIDRTMDGLSGPIIISVKVQNFECTKMLLDSLGGPEKALAKAEELGLQDLKRHINIFRGCYSQSGVTEKPPETVPESYLAQPAGGHTMQWGSASRYPTGLSLDYEERAKSEDVLRQFCEICMNAVKMKFDLNFLADVTKAVSMDISNFFRRCASNSQASETIRPDFLGASRNESPLGFLISQKAIMCEDFVEQALCYFNDKPEEFYQALIKTFHNIQGGEDLPWDIQSVLNRLFSGQFSLNCFTSVQGSTFNPSFGTDNGFSWPPVTTQTRPTACQQPQSHDDYRRPPIPRMPPVANNTSQAPSPVHLIPDQQREHEAERNISRTEATNSQKTSPLSTKGLASAQLDFAASSTQLNPETNDSVCHKNADSLSSQSNVPSLPSSNNVNDDEEVRSKPTNMTTEPQPNNSMDEHHLPASVLSQSSIPGSGTGTTTLFNGALMPVVNNKSRPSCKKAGNNLSQPAPTRSKDGLRWKKKASLHRQSPTEQPPPSKSDPIHRHIDDKQVKTKHANATATQDSSTNRNYCTQSVPEPGTTAMVNGRRLTHTTSTKRSNSRKNMHAAVQDFVKLKRSNIPESQSVPQHIVAACATSTPQSTNYGPKRVQTYSTMSDSESLFSVGLPSRSSLNLDSSGSFTSDSDAILSDADSEVNKESSRDAKNVNHSQLPKSASTPKNNAQPLNNRRRPSRIPEPIKTISTQKQPTNFTKHGRSNSLAPTTLSPGKQLKHDGIQKTTSFAGIIPSALPSTTHNASQKGASRDTKPSSNSTTTHKRKQLSHEKTSNPVSVSSGLSTPNLNPSTWSTINTDSESGEKIRRDPEGSPPEDVRVSTLYQPASKSNSFPRFGSHSYENESHKKPLVSRSQSTPAKGEQMCSKKVNFPLKGNEFKLVEWSCLNKQMQNQNLMLHSLIHFSSGNREESNDIINEHFNLNWLYDALDYAHTEYHEQCATVTFTIYKH